MLIQRELTVTVVIETESSNMASTEAFVIGSLKRAMGDRLKNAIAVIGIYDEEGRFRGGDISGKPERPMSSELKERVANLLEELE